MKTIKIIATASQVPEKIVSNDDLAAIMDTSDDWIKSRTGISNRHIAVNETTSSLAAGALKQLIQDSGIHPEEISYVIVATMSPDRLAPSTAATISAAMGLTNAFAFDVNVACSGFVYALQLAQGLVNSLSAGYGVVIGSEVLSKLVDWQERSTAVLFGDGAAGVLLETTQEANRLLAADLRTYGEQAESLTAGSYVASKVWQQPQTGSPYFQMDGKAVYSFATRQVPASIRRAFDQIEQTPDDSDYFLMHQANQRIMNKAAQILGQPNERFLSNVSEFGNTSSASIPLLLDQFVRQGVIQRDQLLTLTGFGAGLSVGTIIYHF
ncbi:beta-ketoacyl-ACP synthase III [Oenococcus kitaharae]|uniref:Beta-ketoacyl-[acyl-carrier-protein] synthase III n=1 Tax=Oenococcus kitaharae DSM 17330 TaxID=1045004 RepID=G9WEV2_9LACO|nr:beta-ketoacyl-ACP synthase III [Oenococcus kitaharae]EHN58275.1 3-oxoacyl-[acyl-carrier-protein] synth KASIII [Oenococcus kitaharae DSM 17330]OEY81546.1 3-oxoacyl-ACP synthase [Oenococcus kitaharae]OEY83033.1 3-oxoacyl-ACP synthase [Oenococcus kitaharae]OEY84422.1 3-oxoacyl-ACP synthase [Oenococcus kitaharae]